MESPVGKEQFLRSGWRKRERHRSLDGELLPFSLAGEANGRQTERRHGLGIAAGPCGNYSTATAPCTSPHTSLLSPIRSDSTLLRVSMRPIDKLREQIRAICFPKRPSDDRGEQNGIVCTPMGSSAGRRVQKGSFCTPDGPSDVLGVQERRVCTPTVEKQCSVSRLACFAHQRG